MNLNHTGVKIGHARKTRKGDLVLKVSGVTSKEESTFAEDLRPRTRAEVDIKEVVAPTSTVVSGSFHRRERDRTKAKDHN